MNTESKGILKKSAGSLFAAGLAVCLGSGLGVVYLECIRLLADSVLKKNAGGIWGVFAVFSISIVISALLLCVQNSRALTIVDDNIAMGGFGGISPEEIKKATGVPDFSGREISSISQLSGGEQQRVNAARAFSNGKAEIILLDEPTASLDGEHAERLMNYIRSIGATVIYTTHRGEEAAFADRVIRMCGGRIS